MLEDDCPPSGLWQEGKEDAVALAGHISPTVCSIEPQLHQQELLLLSKQGLDLKIFALSAPLTSRSAAVEMRPPAHKVQG